MVIFFQSVFFSYLLNYYSNVSIHSTAYRFSLENKYIQTAKIMYTDVLAELNKRSLYFVKLKLKCCNCLVRNYLHLEMQ